MIGVILKTNNFNNIINTINNIIIKTDLHSKYKLQGNIKYSVEYILKIIIMTSTKTFNGKYKLHPDLCAYLKVDNYVKYSITGIKNIIKNQIINIDYNYINKYVVIGYDVPCNITELNVVL